MHEITEIPVFMDSSYWQQRFFGLAGVNEALNYQAFRQVSWQVDDRREVYFYLIDHFNEHMVNESLGAIIPRAPMVLFCSERAPSADSAILKIHNFYCEHFSTPVAWFFRMAPEEDGENKPFPEDNAVYRLEEDTPEYLHHILRKALKDIYNILLKD